jgi:type IV pilus assembly protein PilE
MFIKHKKKGFSLLELMIVLVIVGILAVIATTLYSRQVKRSRRVDAIQTLLAMQLAQENYRASNSLYGTLAQMWGGVSATTNGYYNLTITNVTATSYTLTATAVSTQTTDAEDSTVCSSLVLTVSNGIDTPTPAACWLNK